MPIWRRICSSPNLDEFEFEFVEARIQIHLVRTFSNMSRSESARIRIFGFDEGEGGDVKVRYDLQIITIAVNAVHLNICAKTIANGVYHVMNKHCFKTFLIMLILELDHENF